jgi:hypothetical protein
MVQWTERKKETGKEKMDDQELVKMVKMVVVVDVVDVVDVVEVVPMVCWWYSWSLTFDGGAAIQGTSCNILAVN